MTMKTLIITEKPSVTRDIASTIGNFKKNDNLYENEKYIIASAIGHLVELYMPEDIDKKLGYWRLGALPIIPENFKLVNVTGNGNCLPYSILSCL